MAQFDVYVRRSGPGFLLDCQAHALDRLITRFVVPLLPSSVVPSLVGQLNPVFRIEDGDVVLMPQNAATVLTRELGPAVASLEPQHYAIIDALDMLLTGY